MTHSKQKVKTIQFWKEIEENLCDLEVGKDLLVETQKAQIINFIVGKLYFITYT